MKLKHPFATSVLLFLLIGVVVYMSINLKYAAEHSSKLSSVTVAAFMVGGLIERNKNVSLDEMVDQLRVDGFLVTAGKGDGVLHVAERPSGVVLYMTGIKDLWTMRPMVIFADPLSRDGAKLMGEVEFFSRHLK